ncbi:MAG TPA: tryptophan synthase subunit alpha [Desulfuromonadales bacterium]|jgi:tryptophan synthase alpha chain
MGRIEAAFARLRQQGETALIPFITAGDPDLGRTEELIHALVEAGADIIELGFPFSDPMADGPVIQAASERALAAGATLPAILELVARVRLHTNIPIVLMGYYNPIFHYGPTRFARDAAVAGVDGLLLVDLPPEEADEIHGDLRAAGVRLITLLAPTTPPERMARLAAAGEGFIYYVSMTGVTGTSQVDAGAIEAAVRSLGTLSPVPVAVGFGISSAADAAAVGSFADAVVVGSALVKVVAAYGSSPELPAQAGAFIHTLKQSLRRRAA